MLTKIEKWGDRAGLSLSKAILDEANIGVGDKVKILVKRGQIIVEPASQARRNCDLLIFRKVRSHSYGRSAIIPTYSPPQ